MNQLTVLIVDDNDDIRFALNLLLSQNEYRVLEATSPLECLQLLQRVTPDLILLDMNFSRDTTSGQEGLILLQQLLPKGISVILMTAWATIDLAVTGLQFGAKDFIEKPWRKDKLLEKLIKHLNPVSNVTSKETEWVAESKEMQELEHLLKQVAPTDANILLLGENGTGKTQLAKRIHLLSNSSSGPFINLNMAAIPDTLFESELFGHKKGAFTDAIKDKPGAFKRAEQGTLFLDEIGVMPLNIQPKLLQVLESGEFTPLGAKSSERAKVRIIAATNENISSAIAQRTFRQDLYYRLNTFVFELPPLRARKIEILSLARHYIAQFTDKYQKSLMTLSPQAEQALSSYHWPGNVRELRHVIERAVIVCNTTIISEALIFLDRNSEQLNSFSSTLTLGELEKQRILQVLAEHQGQISASAKALGISRNALYRRMEKYGLEDRND